MQLITLILYINLIGKKRFILMKATNFFLVFILILQAYICSKIIIMSIQVNHITKLYGEQKALNNVSFEIGTNEDRKSVV